ncbi:DUF2062 domain-containing protein [Sphingomicrobium clamense]|uniref:DUF2062 domain-containing protein n=1 Tax=Sphingomicrobium clamense TaxID=2851013 RepID=A0ABS6V688_9SPHN|nr:DUF2062 domain-containing protein [Sphingomicrobium sp. B8]MBW0145001.1 DUF2062 domain-containing protein [Sphingomicrobium sp. B8]
MDKKFLKWVHRNSPTRHELAESRWLRPVRKYILASEYWRFTRRSVPRAIWAGTFIGIFLMIPGLQMIGATMMSIPLRANIPVAAAITWISNPFTTPFFLVAALEVGGMLGFPTDFAAFMDLFGEEASVQRWIDWLYSAAAPSMIVGLFIIAFISAWVAYFLSLVGWRLWVARKWRQRPASDNIV